MKKENNRKTQINDIISVVKLCSLLLASIGVSQVFLKPFSINWSDKNFSLVIYCTIIIELVVSLIYYAWAFSMSKKINEKYSRVIQLVENIVFIVIFSVIIYITGGYESKFKLLYLFIIIIFTIQRGMKDGMVVACISSMLILGADLLFVPKVDENFFFENDLVLVGIFILTVWILGFYMKVESEYIEKLEGLANKDGLTGIYNHRFFYDYLIEKIEEKKSVSLIFLDIDYFKNYNDIYGHQKGDKILKVIADILNECSRKGDIVARYGGDEFAIIVNEASEEELISIAEIIRKRTENTYFEGEENQPKGKLTVSIGIAMYPKMAKDYYELIKSADDALYRAKFLNKNRVELYNNVLDELKEEIDEKNSDIVTSIKTLIGVINAKDKYTYGHSERVVIYSRLLAEKLNLNDNDKKNLIYGAYMHDIGKINILEEILNKKMPLTNDEWEALKEHPVNGVKIIEPVESLNDIGPLILYHHEKYDGTGYPSGLKGEEIPYLARILAVVDSFDAMTSKRPYSNRKTHEEAIEELKRWSGKQFDSNIVNSFIEVIRKNDGMMN